MTYWPPRNQGNSLCLGVIAMLILTIVACSSESDVNTQAEIRPTSVPELNEASTFDGPLVKAGERDVSRFLKNGIFSATHQHALYQRLETAAPTTPTTDDASADFSITNTQEQGVDEADRIKYNGDTLFLAAYAEWRDEQQVPAGVRVLERQTDFSLAESALLPLAEEFANIDGLYERNGHLAVLSNSSVMYTLSSFAPEPWFPVEHKLSLDIYDTSIPSSPVVKGRIKIDGTMLSSRRIGDDLYIVNGYTPAVDDLNPAAETEKDLLENYLTILDTPIDNLMPKIYVDNDQGRPLNQASDCMIPQKATDKDGYAHIITVLRINMTDLTDIHASCISAKAEVMYMSQSNLYLTSSYENQTVLHKVSLDEDLTYQATGSVPGIIGWRSSPNLRLSEHEGYLRILSSDYSSEQPIHQLSILQQQANQLTVVGQLPNQQRPEPIGKPGEDVYAVRFFADRGYVVTFERIDPLYVLDLASAEDPKVLGELEIPGFSSYLHPLDNGYLLGVGQQVNIREIPANGELIDPVIAPVTQEGMKVSLFDINDPSQPVEINSIVRANSYTPVEYDYRALTVLNTDGFYQFALPVESWGADSIDERRIWWSRSSLSLLEVDTNRETPELIQRSVVSAPVNEGHYIYGGTDRSVIHGSQVYYIHGNQVWRTSWEEEGDVFGPY